MTIRIAILVGTMTGNASLCAEEIELALAGDEIEIEVLPMDALEPAVFADRERSYLILTSTYGQGDVPDNARKFYTALSSVRPDLSGVRFGVFGLGDRTYAETYNQGGRRFEELLEALGAERIGERHAHDASGGEMPEEVAIEWARRWIARVGEAGNERRVESLQRRG